MCCFQRPDFAYISIAKPLQASKTYRVCCDMDAIILAVGNQVIISQHWMTLDLVNRWNDARGIDNSLKLVEHISFVQDKILFWSWTNIFNSVIGDPNRSNLGFWKLCHCCKFPPVSGKSSSFTLEPFAKHTGKWMRYSQGAKKTQSYNLDSRMDRTSR